jgi:hypothetical protein
MIIDDFFRKKKWRGPSFLSLFVVEEKNHTCTILKKDSYVYYYINIYYFQFKMQSISVHINNTCLLESGINC